MNDIIRLTTIFPQLISLSSYNILDTIQIIESFGYSRSDSIKMTLGLPSIFGFKKETLIEKLEFYISINLKQVIKDESKNLIQGLELSYDRYNFLKGLSCFNYKDMFMSQDKFIRKYGYSNEDIINKFLGNKVVKKKK